MANPATTLLSWLQLWKAIGIEEVVGFTDKALLNFPEDPERNLDLEAHGRKTVLEAWVVTVAIFSARMVVEEIPILVWVQEVRFVHGI